MKYYKYDNAGYYCYTAEAQKDPMQSKIDGKDVFLLPPNATFTAPPATCSRPYSHYTLRWTGKEWTQEKVTPSEDNIEKLKADKILELKAARVKAENDPLTSDGSTYDFDTKSRERLLIAMESLGGDKVASVSWTLADNTLISIRLDNIIKIFKDASNRNAGLQSKYKVLKEKVNACTKAGEIEAVTWETK